MKNNKKMLGYLPLVLIAPVLALSSGCQTNTQPGLSRPGNVFSNPFATNNIKANIQQTFDNDPVLTGLPIVIEEQQARVRLSGYVKTIRQSDTAYMLAARVPGVKTVENRLIVRK